MLNNSKKKVKLFYLRNVIILLPRSCQTSNLPADALLIKSTELNDYFHSDTLYVKNKRMNLVMKFDYAGY